MGGIYMSVLRSRLPKIALTHGLLPVDPELACAPSRPPSLRNSMVPAGAR